MIWFNRARTGLIAVLAVVLAFDASSLKADDAPIGDAVKDLPIFDGHMHYKEEAWPGLPEKTVLELMDRNGVAMALVSSSPNEGTLKLYKFAPNRIVPEVQPYDGGIGQTNWTIEEGVFEHIVNRLDAEPHAGIGEIHAHFLDNDNTGMLRRIADLAAKRNLFVHIHGDYQTVDVLFEAQPGLKVIWAHAGLVDPPEQVMKTMNKYRHLYAELSYREHLIFDGKGGLDPAWRAILLKHADRLMVGSDTWSNSQWVRYADLIELNRRWLAQLPRAKAELIAYKNAERFFGRKISKNLIGQR